MANRKIHLSKVEYLINEFISILDEIEKKDKIRLNWTDVISNKKYLGGTSPQKREMKYKDRDGLLYKLHKRFVALDKAIQLYGLLNQNIGIFNQEKNRLIDEIELLDYGLSQKLKLFFNLSASTNLTSVKEIEELNRCISDIERWYVYRLTNRIEFFTERVILFVKGGMSIYDKETFFGFSRYFKDKELIMKMYNTPEVKKLWTYKQEMEFFSRARYAILKSIREEGKWEGFYEFYNNLKKGKNYIKMVRDKFGNLEFAEFLEKFHEKIHEAPEIWEKDLTELSHRLINPTYQNRYIIEPARQALINIFTKKVKDLSTTPVDLKLKTNKEFIKMLTNHRKKLIKTWENEVKKYEIKEREVLKQLKIFKERSEKCLKKIDRRPKFVHYRKTLDSSIKSSNYLSRAIKLLNGRLVDQHSIEKVEETFDRLEARISWVLHINLKLANAEAKSIEELENLEEEDVKDLRSIVQFGSDIVLPILNSFINYIETIANQHFLPGIKEALFVELNFKNGLQKISNNR